MSGFLVCLLPLVVSFAGSVLYDRFFCKYLCPMGGFLGLINRIGWFRIKRNNETCTHCMASCPVKDTLVIEGPRTGRISPQAVLWITVPIFAATIGITTATGRVEWTLKSLEKVTEERRAFDPAQIKGTDTFKQISELSGVPKAEFLAKFKISEKDFESPVREAATRESIRRLRRPLQGGARPRFR